MGLKVNIKEIEDNVLNPLNEILVLSYGTDMYTEILCRIERIVRTLEQHHLIYKRWQ